MPVLIGILVCVLVVELIVSPRVDTTSNGDVLVWWTHPTKRERSYFKI